MCTQLYVCYLLLLTYFSAVFFKKILFTPFLLPVSLYRFHLLYYSVFVKQFVHFFFRFFYNFFFLFLGNQVKPLCFFCMVFCSFSIPSHKMQSISSHTLSCKRKINTQTQPTNTTKKTPFLFLYNTHKCMDVCEKEIPWIAVVVGSGNFHYFSGWKC